VIDDGVGIGAGERVSGAFGAWDHNLRERAEMTGGQLHLLPGESGSGTRARIEWR